MANSIGRRGGSGTVPAIGSPGGNSSPAVSPAADGAAGATGVVIGGAIEPGAPLFVASLLIPRSGGAVAFGLGHTTLPVAPAGEAVVLGPLSATCIGLGVGPAGWADAGLDAVIGWARAAGAAGAAADGAETIGLIGGGAAGFGATGG